MIGVYVKLEQTLVPSSECIYKISKIRTYSERFKIIQGHRSWCQSKAHIRLPISH